MDRKEFLKSSILLCGAAMCGTAFLESCSKNDGFTAPSPVTLNFTLDLTAASNSALKTIGGFIESNNVIIIRNTNTTYIALSNVCTHNGCTINYDNIAKNLYCPCHGGTFDTNGTVLGGPPPSPLQVFKTSLNGNNLTVKS